MKILHTADWHLGHRLHEHSQNEEQVLFLEWLENYIEENKIDILLISGDIFDTGSPSSQSLKMYYGFLAKLIKTPCKHIVIAGGNHDSPGTINAPKELLNALSIKVTGRASEEIKDDIFIMEANGEEIIIAAIPYLRDQDIRRAVAGETFDEINDRYKQALINHYRTAATYCDELKTENTAVIAMGHLFAVGGSISDSEQNIYVGTLGHIGANDFPELFDYIALGHLHRPQVVGGKEHIRYSGSPNILSFSEVGYDKKIIQIETYKNKVIEIKEMDVPKFREIIRIKGTLEDCVSQLKVITNKKYQLTPWVEVILDDHSNRSIGASEIHKVAEDLNIEVLKVSLEKQQNIKDLEKLIKETRHIRELSPVKVFEMKCEEQDFDIKDHKEIWDAFNEALQIAMEN
jgi:exonuclease SbcD